MSDKKKSEEEVIRELADMRLLIDKAEARQRHAEKATPQRTVPGADEGVTGRGSR